MTAKAMQITDTSNDGGLLNWEQTIHAERGAESIGASRKNNGCLARIHPLDLDRSLVRLTHDETIIGRDDTSDLFIDDPSVSRKHALIKSIPEGYAVLDLNSTNGTYVDDVRISQHTLTTGARIRVGNHIYKFLINDHIETQYYETVYSMMTHDGLTEAFNKRYLTDILEREFERSIRYSRPLSVAMLDLDKFKQVNDQHGHLAGDDVLKEFVRRAAEAASKDHILARYGGEEFALVMSESNVALAVATAEKCRQLVEATPFSTCAGDIAVTVSCGVAELDPSRHSKYSDLIAEADARLYRAKQGGRNQVCSG
ncbi:MAG: GGDEF domain-containing protein [Planctomycetota bacterium]|nr:GGDEF domain-containing protein [Planctomycetota bacterium]MDA1179965.1 GGDEF domain-containing protein [Planctomycetota bacterium]